MTKRIISLIILYSLASMGAGAADLALQDNPPERYIVVPGDTLWGIAGRFLKQPWRWPELMRLNKDQIRNPNLIYPGDVLVLDVSGDSARLRLVQAQTIRLEPRARSESLQATAIPTITPAAIEPFLTQPLVLNLSALNDAPKIVATQENRVVIGAGNTAYARGLAKDGGEFWQLFRAGDALIDPESKEPLGYEAIYLGEARVIKPGAISTIELLKTTQEVYTGDRLFAAPKTPFPSYVPRAPEKPIVGRIISAYGAMYETGRLGIVTLNRGTRDGVEAGHVLAISRSSTATRDVVRNEPLWGRSGLLQLQRRPDTVSQPISGVRNAPLWGVQGPTGRDESLKGAAATPQLPDERYGLVFVFRTFERVSYAIVMEASRPVELLDVVQNP